MSQPKPSELEEFIRAQAATLPRQRRPITTSDSLTVQGEATQEMRELSQKEVKEMAKALVTDPLYLSALQARLRQGKVAPAVEVNLWHFAFGKPKEQIEVKKASVVKIVHEFAQVVEAQKIASQVLEGQVLEPKGNQDAVEPDSHQVPESTE